ncbi:MAG TPA: YcgL domain-containing protein [Xanthomonadales bacterium]
MKCSVVRSSLKDFTYIYLLEGQDFDDLPEELKRVFGKPEFVMNLQLSPERKLAYEDIKQVMHNLSEQGYHLQLPPKEDASGLLDLPASRKEP